MKHYSAKEEEQKLQLIALILHCCYIPYANLRVVIASLVLLFFSARIASSTSALVKSWYTSLSGKTGFFSGFFGGALAVGILTVSNAFLISSRIILLTSSIVSQGDSLF